MLLEDVVAQTAVGDGYRASTDKKWENAVGHCARWSLRTTLYYVRFEVCCGKQSWQLAEGILARVFNPCACDVIVAGKQSRQAKQSFRQTLS